MKKVAIIGAGPCGLAQLQAFAAAKQKGIEIPEIVCFEKQADWGGLWNYSWRTGTAKYGEAQHSSMYRYLWSNGPKECLEFADYSFEEHFGKPIPSFPPRAVLEDYILGRSKKSNVRDFIRFNTAVRNVSFNESNNQFSVVSEDLEKQTTKTELFDFVVVATGHFSTPNIPDFAGIKTFQGRVMHSHDFRDAREFTNKNVLIVGASYSAEDIGLQCHKYGANSVTISYRTSAMGFKWPKGIEEKPLLTSIKDKTVIFKDNSSGDFDAIILCTGYLHYFPFIEDSLRLKATNRLYPPKIYKGIFFEANPRMMYIGMQDQFYTFSMFDAQAWYARNYILGKISLPNKSEMESHTAKWVEREENLETDEQMIRFQADYIRELCAETDYPKFDLDLTVDEFIEWEHDKVDSILGYRNKCFKSPVTGAMSPSHHTEWLEAMDDSMQTYLDTK